MLARLQQTDRDRRLLAPDARWRSGVGHRARLGLGWALACAAARAAAATRGFSAIEFVWLRALLRAGRPMRPGVGQLVARLGRRGQHRRRACSSGASRFARAASRITLPATSRGRRGVLLVHGFFCNRGLWNPLAASAAPAATCRSSPSTSSRCSARSTTTSTIIDAAVARLEQATGLAPVIVAHSMGGLAVRAGSRRSRTAPLHRVVTIASPHARHPARRAWPRREHPHRCASAATGWRSWRRASRRRCARASPASGATATTSSSRRAARRCPGPTTATSPATPHVQMVDHPAVFDEVLRLVAEPAAPSR